MSTIDRPDPVILGHILAQHSELHCQIVAARNALSPEAAPDAAGIAAAREALAVLRGHLADHFSQEERGGFLEESIARMPRLSRAVQAVIDEHPRLLAALDRLCDLLAGPVVAAADWRRAGQEFDAFAALLLAHERHENAVVQEGYNEDLGLVD